MARIRQTSLTEVFWHGRDFNAGQAQAHAQMASASQPPQLRRDE